MGQTFVSLVEVRLDDHSQQEINFCMHELKKVKNNTSGCKICTCRKKILRMVPIIITLLSHLSALKKFQYLLQPSATSEIWFNFLVEINLTLIFETNLLFLAIFKYLVDLLLRGHFGQSTFETEF